MVMAEEKLTLKVLEGRINRLKRESEEFADNVYERFNRIDDHIRQMELDSTRSSGLPEYASDILVATINALYAQRSQGANKMAKGLEHKYFEGRGMKSIGDELTQSGDLWTATKGRNE